MPKPIQIVLAAALIAVTSVAPAPLVTWHLENAMFEDGGTASGFFAVDTANDTLPNFAVGPEQSASPPPA